MFGRFTKICHNNPIFSYSQTKITGSQLENFRTIMIIANDYCSLQLRQRPLCEIRAKVEVKAEYLNTTTNSTYIVYPIVIYFRCDTEKRSSP